MTDIDPPSSLAFAPASSAQRFAWVAFPHGMTVISSNQLGAPIGASDCPADAHGPADVLALADERPYAADRAGGSLLRAGVEFAGRERMPAQLVMATGYRSEP